MALTPIDETHALQIQAGISGRRGGHEFEDQLTKAINEIQCPFAIHAFGDKHVVRGDPAALLLQYVGCHLGITSIKRAVALSTGKLATSEEGKRWLSINGANVTRCKSDIVLTVAAKGGEQTVGISTKQCNTRNPTNAQLYFTTARAFCALLRANGIAVSEKAEKSLRQFCGNPGFQPLDQPALLTSRKIDPRRYFWEELDGKVRLEWEKVFAKHQDDISRMLFQKAYLDDPFVPEYLIHKTKRAPRWDVTEVAIYSVDELIALSRKYQGFSTKEYPVRKGRYKDPPGVRHLAPRFGVIQIQLSGQVQHPDQLQFNLEVGYFYKIE